jgi:SPP1 gp7 family putative phage head morphogenesis protein
MDRLRGDLARRLVTIEERGLDIGPATTKRIERQIREINAIVSDAYTKTNAEILDELQELAADEVEFTTKAIKRAKANVSAKATKAAGKGPRVKLEIQFSTRSPAPTMVKAIVATNPMSGKHLKAWADKMSADTQAKVGDAIRAGLQSGKSVEQIVRDIVGSKKLGTPSVLDASRKSVEAMVRTAVTHIHNTAAQASYAENGDVVKGWRYLSVLDSRTTVTCMGLSGKVFPIGKGPIPPNHVRCRSLCQPVTATLRELGLDVDENTTPGDRASEDGPLRGDITMDRFLKTKSADVQNSMLGKKKAELFRAGKLSLSDLVAIDGRELTIKELRALHPKAFE